MFKGLSSNLRWTVTSASIALLAACGGEDVSSPTPIEPVELSVQNGILSIASNELASVEVRDYIQYSSGASAKLVKVTGLGESASCSQPSLNGESLSFFAQVATGVVCEYEYTVEAQRLGSSEVKTQTARVGVVHSTAEDLLLMPLSQVAEVGNGSAKVVLDVKKALADLGEVIPGEYTLSDEFELLGDGVVQMNQPAQGEVTFTTAAKGLHRIVYTLVDPSNNANRVGSIDVSVSEGVNEGIVADDKGVYPDAITSGQQVEIDVTPYVTVPDGDDFKITYVNAFNADVSLKDPASDSNKIFNFSSHVLGSHYISYVVSDLKGGVDAGMLELDVIPNQSALWKDIQSGLSVYSAPLTFTEANDQSAGHVGYVKDVGYSPVMFVSSFDFNGAKNYCNGRGRLPTSAELSALSTAETPNTKHNWPVASAFWADDSGAGKLVDLKTGTVSDGDAKPHYVTCLENGSLTAVAIVPEAVADGVEVATVEVTYELAGKPYEGAEIYADIINGQATLIDTNLKTDADGKAQFSATSFKAERVEMALDAENDFVRQFVTFVGDKKTARVNELEVTKDNELADNQSWNELMVKIADANLNPIAGRVLIESDGDATLIGGEGYVTTNDLGVASAKLISGTPEVVTVTASHSNSLGDISSLSQRLTFRCDSMAGACIDIFDTGTGKLFTSSPSVAYLDSIGGSATDSIYNENGTSGPVGEFYTFSWANADALCTTYNTHSLGGRTNWRLATRDELKMELYDAFGEMFFARGWPTSKYYWSATPVGGLSYWFVGLFNGYINGVHQREQYYASCVSNP